MLILAGVSINAMVGDNGIISNAQMASVMSRFSTYNEELGMNALEDTGVYASGEKINKYIPSMEEKDKENFVIMKSKLLYIGTNELEMKVATNLGLRVENNSDTASDTGAAIKEIQSIIGGVVELQEKYEVPIDDSQGLEEPEHKDNAEGLIGTRLFDRSGLNLSNKTWNILIEYDKNNQEVERYGSGYYWLKKGETYIIDGEAKEFKNDYVVDYANNEYIVISGRAVNWNEVSTLGVTEGLALNVDPMSLADGEWIQNETDSVFYDFYVTNSVTGEKTNTGTKKTGDVVYDSLTRSLKFNEDSNNISGEGGYLKLQKSGLTFVDGFSFELYANLSRLDYNRSGYPSSTAMGIFCRIPNLNSASITDAIRFGYQVWNGGTVGKFYGSSSWHETGMNMRTRTAGYIVFLDGSFYASTDEDFYFTCVYSPYNSAKLEEFKSKYSSLYESGKDIYDEYMDTNKVDKVLFYKNSKLLGYTYYGHDSFEAGRAVWDNDATPFFVGVCPWSSTPNTYFLKGNVYSTRLYTLPLTAEQVIDNYNTTLKYRSSF